MRIYFVNKLKLEGIFLNKILDRKENIDIV
jgi:hypothetical protein